jgi:D-alanyl-D-alanine carboxypeptidase/D-alanyl-D-alanine-endopeptidase (penicillin-binding protein 4)
VLGAEIAGVPGTREKGLGVLKGWLEHVTPGGCPCTLMDGSGLAPTDRLTSRMLSDVLMLMNGSSYAAPEFIVSLPVSGVDGTLRRRFRGTAASRLVRAKTGRINDVAALSGIANVEPGRKAVFSILLNDYHCASWKAEGAIDRMVQAIVADAPPMAQPRIQVEEDDEAPPAGADDQPETEENVAPDDAPPDDQGH